MKNTGTLDEGVCLAMKLYRVVLVCLVATAINNIVQAEGQTSGGHRARVAAQPPAEDTEVSISNTRKIDLVSRVNGHRYQIRVALPLVMAPGKRYPVLYVLDGNGCFAAATEMARSNPAGTVVVGIGYPEDPAYVASVLARRGPLPSYLAGFPRLQSSHFLERDYDLTLPVEDAVLAAETLKGLPPDKRENVGGLDDFLKMIETDIKPRVGRLANIDNTNQALFGSSLGGLAVLHALFVEPNAFRTFIMASPSIWWGNRKEPAFVETVKAGNASPRVLVTVGSLEDTPQELPPEWGVDPESNAAWYRMARMIENAGDLVTRLKALHGGPRYEVADYVVFDHERHGEATWSALARGIPFAFDGEE